MERPRSRVKADIARDDAGAEARVEAFKIRSLMNEAALVEDPQEI